MRYGVNFYRERVNRGARLRRGVVRGIGLGLVVGVEVLLLAALVISGFQLHARAEAMKRDVTELEAAAGPHRESPELPAARVVLQARVDRVDWAPILAAVAEATPRNVILSRIQGGVGKGRGALNGLDIEGRVTGRTRDLSMVIAYIDSLRKTPVLQERFPQVDLGTAKGETGRKFRVVCRPAPAKEGS